MQFKGLSEIRQEKSRRYHLDFIKYCWEREETYKVGYHTRLICDRIDAAIEDFKKGKSTFLKIKCPFRHGKSEIVSVNLPARYIGMFPDNHVIVVGYSTELVHTFSRYSRDIVRGGKFKQVFPGVVLSDDKQALESWAIRRKRGVVQWVGIDGSITGKGGNLIIVDDFFKNRESAESETMRNKVWEAITNDVMTRRSDPCIVIILATPWHTDDVFGRIDAKMNEDPLFPSFEELKFPAFNDRYPKDGILFPERFSREWYDGQRSALGEYAASGLLQCDPVQRAGALFKADKINFVDTCPQDITYIRGWDLASTTKQISKQDPDYTVGAKVGIRWIYNYANEKVPVVYVDSLIRGRWEGPERDRIIKDTTINDGQITAAVESFGAYKDAYTTLSRVLFGIRTVRPMRLSGDKITKMSTLAPIIEAGNFYIKRGVIADELVNELLTAPSGKHDDIIDAITVAIEAHNPYRIRIFRDTSMSDFELNIEGMGKYKGLVITLWVNDLMQAHCLMAQWNTEKNNLMVFGEEVLDNCRPEAVLVALSKNLRNYTNDRYRNLKNFDWYGNDAFFGKSSIIQSDMRYAYKKYNLSIRDVSRYNAQGGILLTNRLIMQQDLYIHSRCPELYRQLMDWYMEDKKPAEGYELCHSLMLMISALYEKKRLIEKPPQQKTEYATEFDTMNIIRSNMRFGQPIQAMPVKAEKANWAI